MDENHESVRNGTEADVGLVYGRDMEGRDGMDCGGRVGVVL